MASCTKHPVGRYWRHFVIILTPLLLLFPLFLIPEETMPFKANQCLYVMLLMAVYWCTEVLSLAVTACIPIFLFPLFGMLTTRVVCDQYLKDTVMMFVGGLMVALAVEKCNLHKRIAVNVLYIVGTKPIWLMLGFMLPTWFLSMWISNTATTAMMLPICEAVLESLEKSLRNSDEHDDGEENEKVGYGEANLSYIPDDSHEKQQNGGPTEDEPQKKPNIGGEIDKGVIVIEEDKTYHPDMLNTKNYKWNSNTKDINTNEKPVSPNVNEDKHAPHVGYRTTGNARLDKFAKGMTLAVAYAANTGGTATLIGTPPNTIMKGFADDIWDDRLGEESPVTFASWIIYGFPVAAINIIIVWLWLVIFFNGCRALCPCCTKNSSHDKAIKTVIKKEYKQLGKITFAEVIVSIMFILMVVLWFFKSPKFIKGWADFDTFKPGYIHDAVVSIFIAFVLCIIPSKIPCKDKDTGPVDTLLDWTTIHNKLPWGIIFLLGGGFAIAKASTASGLSDWIAERLAVITSLPGWVMVLVLCIIVAFLTEITSNSATCTILMPIAASLADSIGKSPLYLMFPVALTCSFAFMLPVATPPNAIAFSYGRLKIIDMVKAGFILNFLCVGVVTLATHTWADAFFDFDTVPWDTRNMTTATTLLTPAAS